MFVEPGATDRLYNLAHCVVLFDQNAIWIKQKPKLYLSKSLVIVRYLINCLLGVDGPDQSSLNSNPNLLDEVDNAATLYIDLSLKVLECAEIIRISHLLHDRFEVLHIFC